MGSRATSWQPPYVRCCIASGFSLFTNNVYVYHTELEEIMVADPDPYAIITRQSYITLVFDLSIHLANIQEVNGCSFWAWKPAVMTRGPQLSTTWATCGATPFTHRLVLTSSKYSSCCMVSIITFISISTKQGEKIIISTVTT